MYIIEASFPYEKIARRDQNSSLFGSDDDIFQVDNVCSHSPVPVPFYERIDPSPSKVNFNHNKLPVKATPYTMHYLKW
jgi:hypothetical protein